MNRAAFTAVNSALRRGSKLVIVALPAHGTSQVPIVDTVLNGTSVIGAIAGTRQDLAEVLPPHAAGRHQGHPRDASARRRQRPHRRSNDEVLRGQVKARIVFDLGMGA